MKLFFGIISAFLLTGSSASAQDAHAYYEIDGQEWGLFGYYVSAGNRPHFLAVFRPSNEQSSEPDEFDFRSACEAVVASLPKIDGLPSIEPTGAAIFFQVVRTRMLVFSTTDSSFVEFDVDEGGCVKAEPGSIYVPNPAFTPGISN